MRARGKCKVCGKEVETTDPRLIASSESFHDCGGELKFIKVKWNKLPESASEFEDIGLI
jgi:hypothetical protein